MIRTRFPVLLLVFLLGPQPAALALEPLRLVPAPGSSAERGGGTGTGAEEEVCHQEENPAAAPSAAAAQHQGSGPAMTGAGGGRSGDKTAERRDNGGGVGRGHGGRNRSGPPLLESEHRPLPQRSYRFGEYRRRAMITAYVRRPDGAVLEPELILGAEPRVSFPTPLEDGPAHGPHNVYVVEQEVEDGMLAVRTAKWITMHHRCNWGHEGRFDPLRLNPQPLADIPFEVVIEDLWSPNFHARVSSGDWLRIRVLAYGEPVAGATVTLTTEQGWSKTVTSDEEGIASLQLIRDYYPALWQDFRRNHRSRFEVVASYRQEKTGEFRGKLYGGIHYLTSHPWVYSPPARDYSSYTFGLLLAGLVIIIGGGGVYLHRERRKRPYREIVFDD